MKAAAAVAIAAACFLPSLASAAEIDVSDGVKLILDALQSSRADVEGIRLRREILDEAVADGDRKEAFELLSRQASAAAELGQTSRELAIRRRMLELARGTEMEVRALADLVIRERQVGNFQASDTLRRELLEKGHAAGPHINAWGSLAVQAARQGRGDEADEAFARAESSYALANSGRVAATWFRDHFRAILENFRAGLLLARGRERESEAAYRRALDSAAASLRIADRRRAVLGAASPAPTVVHVLYDNIEAGLVNCLVEQGRFGEAEVMLRDRIRRLLARVGGTSPEVAGSAQMFADLLARQSRFADAEALSGAVLDIYAKIGVEPSSNATMDAVVARATALFGLHRHAEAVRVIDEWPAVESRGGSVRGTDYVISKVRAGGGATALAAARAVVRRSEARYGADHIRSGEARGALAMVQNALGRRTEALGLFRDALQTILLARTKTQSTAEEAVSRLRFEAIAEDYLSLLWSMKAGGAEGLTSAQIDEESFRVADALLAGSVQRAVASSAARNSADPALAQMTRREQELGREIATLAELVASMDAAPPAQQLPRVMADMRARIATAGAEQQRLLDEMDRRFPAYARLVSPRPVTGAEFAGHLGPAEAALVAYTGQRQHFVWSVDAGGIRSFRAIDAGMRVVLDDIQPIRRSIDPYAHGLRDVPPYPLAQAFAVYEKYFRASLEALPEARSLIVAANAPFASLPISLLPLAASDLPPDEVAYREYRKVPWLIGRYAVSQTPSANALVLLRTAAPRPPATQPFVGFGDPIFDKAQLSTQASIPELEVRGRGRAAVRGVAARTRGIDRDEYRSLARLPDTAEEVQSVAKALNAGPDSVFLQARANEKELKSRDLTRTRVVFFATHGLVPGELTGLNQPALALSAPEVAGIDGDGLLTQEEVLGLSLGADWVVLSACNTASADGRGGEALSGLGRAFFYAGARSLLLSHWPVETVSARLLTTRIFVRDTGALSKAQAVQAAMKELIETGEARAPDGSVAYAYAHPLFWAPFTVVGDAR